MFRKTRWLLVTGLGNSFTENKIIWRRFKITDGEIVIWYPEEAVHIPLVEVTINSNLLLSLLEHSILIPVGKGAGETYKQLLMYLQNIIFMKYLYQ